MILRDPVHGLVSFDGEDERLILKLLACREVQRLRRVKQLGLTSLVFPGAEHSRFSHALGTAHVMVRLLHRIGLDQQRVPADVRVERQDRADALAAALLHDLGHGPFSHLFEELLPNAKSHEHWTRAVLEDADTDVHKVLESVSAGMSDRVANMLRGEHRLRYLARAVSGMIDVDRADYLLRDSLMTGARYGLYDLDWLLQAFALDQCPTGEWVLAVEGRKGIQPFEGFFLGRHFMYKQVYHHKATRSAECLMRALFRRVLTSVREEREDVLVPAALRHAAREQEVSVTDYLALDDVQLGYCVSVWSESRDPLLADLASRLLRRELPKTLPLDEGRFTPDEMDALTVRLREASANHGFDPDYYIWRDETVDVPFREPNDDGPDGAWVAIAHQPITRLGDLSPVLGELRGKRFRSERLVFPAELREALESLL